MIRRWYLVMKGLLPNIGLLFLSILVLFLVLELFLQFFALFQEDVVVDVSSLAEENGYEDFLGKRLLRHRGVPFAEQYDEEFSVSYVHNSVGIRDREYTLEKPEGVFRIVVLGDSVAYGSGVAAEESFPEQLEGMFSGGVEVLNFALPGYSSFDEYVALRDQALAYDPDLVLVAYVLNDAYYFTGEESQGCRINILRLPVPCSVKYGLLDLKTVYYVRVALQDLLYGRIEQVDGGSVDSWIAVHEDPYGAAMVTESFSRIVELSDAPVLLVLFPIFHDFEEYRWEGLHSLVKGFAVGMDVLDLYEVYKDYDPLFLRQKEQDAVHPNAEGHRIAAEAVYATLINKGYVGGENGE